MKHVLKDVTIVGLALAVACFVIPAVVVNFVNVSTPPKPANLFAQLVDRRDVIEEHSGNLRYKGQLLQKLPTNEMGNCPTELKKPLEGTPDPSGVLAMGDGLWLLTGATIKSKACSDPKARSTDNYLFQRQTKNYRSVASLSEGRVLHSMLKLSDGRVLIFGGCDISAVCIDSFELLDLKRNTCSIICHSSEGKSGTDLVEIKPNIVLAIGARYPDSTAVELIDIDSHTCTMLGHLNKSRCYSSVYRVSPSEYLVVGGYNSLSEPDSNHLPPELIKVPATMH